MTAILGKALALAAKLIKLGGRGVKIALKTTPKIGAFLQAHPSITGALVGLSIADDIGDKVNEVFKSNQVTDKDVENLVSEATDKIINQLTDSIKTMSEYNKNRNSDKPNNNDDADWMADNQKMSGYSQYSGLSPASALNRQCVRNLYMHKPRNLDISEHLFPTAIKDMIWSTYYKFYSRMFQEPPKSKDDVIYDLSKICYNSFLALMAVFQMRKINNCTQAELDSNVNYGSGLAGVSPLEISQYEPRVSLASLGGLFIAAETGTNAARGPVIGTSDINPSVAFVRYQKYSMSNDAWATLISRVKKLPISDAAFAIADYIVSPVWVEDTPEDYAEIINIFPPVSTALDGEADVDVNYAGQSTYLTTFDNAFAEAINTLASDKAYAGMLTLLGLMPESVSVSNNKSTWRTTMDDRFKRDPMHATIEFRRVDDKFYTTLANSTYNIYANPNRYPYITEYIIHPETWFRNPDGSFKIDRVHMGKRRPLKVGNISDVMPKPTQLKAGYLASILKFAKIFQLRIGPTMRASGATTWYVAPSTCPSLSTTGSAPLEGIPLAQNTTPVTIAEALADMGINDAFGLLPCQQKFSYAIGASVGPLMYGHITQLSGYDRFTSQDFDTITDFAYSNLLLGYYSLGDIQIALDKLDVLFAIANL